MTAWTKKTATLNTGATIPLIGLGTWQSKPDQVRHAVAAALKTGYRHIDTAAAYGNEAEVGQGIVNSGVPRSEIFLTSKLNNPDHKNAKGALEKTLKELGEGGGGYLDLWLMHWPASTIPGQDMKHYDDWNFVNTWEAMQEIYEDGTGRVKAIGISNFVPKNLNILLSAPTTKIVPAVNQVELHPNNPSPKLVALNKEKGIHTTAYSCLGSTDSPLMKDQTLKAIADKYGKSVQQTLLVWGLQRGTSVIPKSVTPARIAANFDLDGFDPAEEDVKALDSLPDRFKVCGDSWLPVKVFFGDDE